MKWQVISGILPVLMGLRTAPRDESWETGSPENGGARVRP